MNVNDASPYNRNFKGYGANPPDPKWPGRSRVAVSLVVNVEAGSELSVADGDERNESVYDIVEPVDKAPNYCLASHFDYGPRVGCWRIMRMLERFNVPRTISAAGRAIERSPAMMSVGLHPRLIGRPGRIAGLEKFLEHVQTKGRTWFARRMDIAHHWRELMGLAPWKERSAGREESSPVS